MKNGRILALNQCLQALSTIGTDDDEIGLRLTQQILFLQPHAETVIKLRDDLLLAKKRDSAEIEVSLFMNKESLQLDFSGVPTYTFEELRTKFKTIPSSSLIAALVPLVVFPTKDKPSHKDMANPAV